MQNAAIPRVRHKGGRSQWYPVGVPWQAERRFGANLAVQEVVFQAASQQPATTVRGGPAKARSLTADYNPPQRVGETLSQVPIPTERIVTVVSSSPSVVTAGSRSSLFKATEAPSGVICQRAMSNANP